MLLAFSKSNDSPFFVKIAIFSQKQKLRHPAGLLLFNEKGGIRMYIAYAGGMCMNQRARWCILLFFASLASEKCKRIPPCPPFKNPPPFGRGLLTLLSEVTEINRNLRFTSVPSPSPFLWRARRPACPAGAPASSAGPQSSRPGCRIPSL